MTAPRKTIKTPRTDARVYLGKAREFSTEARAALDGSRYDAAVLNAVHAAIAAADAVCVALGGRRSADADHQRAADLLEEIGGSSPAIAGHVRQFRAVLSRKNAVEYESRRATARDAADAVQRTERLVAWAGETLHAARL